MRSRRRAWGRRALLTAGAGLAGLAVSELLARTLAEPSAPRPSSSGEILRESAEPGRGFELIPASVQRIEYRDGRGREWAVEHQVGAHVWRGATFERPKRPGTFRIACVGDSNGFGWGVDEAETWPAQLEALARGVVGTREVEVLNLGVPNTNAEEKGALAIRIALELDCDLVLVQLCHDDVKLDGVRLGAVGRDARWLARLQPGRAPWLDFVRARSRAVDVFAESLRRRLGAQAYVRECAVALRPRHPSRARIDTALRQVANAARARGVEVAAVVYPMPIRVGGAWASREIDAWIGEIAREEGLATLDLSTHFDDAGPEPLWVHPLDLHVNERGHRAAAEATLAWLRETGSLDRALRRASEHRVDEGRDDRQRLQADEQDRDR